MFGARIKIMWEEQLFDLPIHKNNEVKRPLLSQSSDINPFKIDCNMFFFIVNWFTFKKSNWHYD